MIWPVDNYEVGSQFFERVDNVVEQHIHDAVLYFQPWNVAPKQARITTWAARDSSTAEVPERVKQSQEVTAGDAWGWVGAPITGVR